MSGNMSKCFFKIKHVVAHWLHRIEHLFQLTFCLSPFPVSEIRLYAYEKYLLHSAVHFIQTTQSLCVHFNKTRTFMKFLFLLIMQNC